MIAVRAPVAQWIERRPPEPKVAGSNPVGRAISLPRRTVAPAVLGERSALPFVDAGQPPAADRGRWALDVSRQTVSAIEIGKYEPSPQLAFRLARQFGRSIEKIFEDASEA
jgi:hypothetical protein